MLKRVDRYFEDNTARAGLGRASLRSGVVLISARLVNVIVQVASTIVLARLLDPRDFGLATLVLSLTALAPALIDLGTTDASTQKTHITRGEISTLFWINVAIAVALTIPFAASSWLIASIFEEPALVGITLVSSLTFILTALSIQHYALMRRAMDFSRVVAIDISANLISSLFSIGLALAGWSYWAVIAKPILSLILTALGAWLSCPWMPGRPRLDAEVKRMIGFGLGVTGFAVTDQLTRSLDRLALGYLYGPGPLGYFQNAFLLYNNMIGLLTESLHNVAVSALSKLREDADALKRSWSAALSLVSFVSAAAFATVAVSSQDFVILLLGKKWEAAGPILCLFALRGIAHGVERTLGWLHVVAGRSDRWMRWGVFSAGLQLCALAVGLPFGAVGVAAAYAVVTFCLFIPTLAYAGRPLGIGARDVVAAVGPQVASALVAVVVGFAIQQAFLAELSHLARFVVIVPICLTSYLLVVIGIFRVTGPIEIAVALLRDFIAGRRKDVA